MTGGQQDNTEGQTKEGSHEPTSPISMSGSERRPSFAEYNENPAPQLVSIDAGVANNENATQGNDADNASSVTLPLVLSLVEPDIGDRRGPAVVYAERERSWIAKHKMWVIIGLVLAVFVTIAVTVAVWEVEQKRNSKTAQGESVGAGARCAFVSDRVRKITTDKLPHAQHQHNASIAIAYRTNGHWHLDDGCHDHYFIHRICSESFDEYLSFFSLFLLVLSYQGASVFPKVDMSWN